MGSVQTCVRAAAPADYPVFVRFFAELGTGDSPLTEARWRSVAMPSSLFFERDRKLVGYCMFETLAETGYIRHVVVAPEARGRGVGRAIMDELRRRIRASGCRSMCLNVKPDNRAAIALYERAGMHPCHRAMSFGVTWAQVARLPSARLPLTAASVSPDEDGAFEQSFRLERGIISRRRELPDLLVLGLRTCAPLAEAVGVLCFDPHFPGAFPFCARDAGAARALLEALQRRANGLSGCALVIEDDEPLCAAFKAVGAELRLEVTHYHGAV